MFLKFLNFRKSSKRSFSMYFVVFDITIVFSVQKLVRGKVLNVPLAVFKTYLYTAGRFLTFSMVAAVDDDVSFVTTTSSSTASPSPLAPKVAQRASSFRCCLAKTSAPPQIKQTTTNKKTQGC